MSSYKRGKHIPGGYDYIAGVKIFDSKGPNLYIVILFLGFKCKTMYISMLYVLQYFGEAYIELVNVSKLYLNSTPST